MTLTIALPPEEQKKLADKAAASGRHISEYVHELIKRDIEQPSLAELFAPVHEAVRNSRVTAEELDSLIEESIGEARRERNAKRTA